MRSATDTGFEALVIARPEDLTTVEILPCPRPYKKTLAATSFNIGFITPTKSQQKPNEIINSVLFIQHSQAVVSAQAPTDE